MEIKQQTVKVEDARLFYRTKEVLPWTNPCGNCCIECDDLKSVNVKTGLNLV